jgi:aryl-alcohol dehydrogenase-like predicted oxidoreductase
MKYNKLGDSDLLVSEICLGTMTYGQQNLIEEASQQLDFALANGVNFIDTAEMYPVPARAETQGKTEEYLGEWLARQQRDQVIIATKIAGRSTRLSWIRGGKNQIDRQNIAAAIETSLKRLQTDYIDLYQIHWPDRSPLWCARLRSPARTGDYLNCRTVGSLCRIDQSGQNPLFGLK